MLKAQAMVISIGQLAVRVKSVKIKANNYTFYSLAGQQSKREMKGF